tara:strand:- start:10805 stop:10987 length:183 start_codon:yes stop_codon:yes gene_type:complete
MLGLRQAEAAWLKDVTYSELKEFARKSKVFLMTTKVPFGDFVDDDGTRLNLAALRGGYEK